MYRFAIMLLLCSISGGLLKAQQADPVAPSDSAWTSDTVIGFVWNTVPGSNITYQFQVSADPLFSTTIIDQSMLVANHTTISLSPHQQYWWRTRHAISGNPQVWSSPFQLNLFAPTAIPGLVAWLECDTGIVLSGNQVQTWQSRYGTWAMSQSDPTKRPLFTDTMLFGSPALSFDGSNDFLQGAFLNHAGLTIVIMHHPLNKNSSLFSQARYTFTGFNWFTNNSSRPTFQCLQPPGSTAYTFSGYAQPFTIPSANVTIDGLSLSNQKHTIYTRLQDSSSAQTISFLDLPSSTNSRLGAMGNNSAYFKGDVYAVLVYSDTLSKDQYTRLYRYLTWKYQPPVNLGPDIHLGYQICPEVLSTEDVYKSYLWSTNDTTSSIQIDTAGVYWLEVTDYLGRVSRDTVLVTGHMPVLSLHDTTICLYDTIWLQTGLTGSYAYQWNSDPMLNMPVLPVDQSGTYRVKVTDTLGCFLTDSMMVFVDAYALGVSLGPDVSICAGEPVALVLGAAQTIGYQWSSGVNDTLPYIIINTPGNYSVSTTNLSGCNASDTINITIKGISPMANFQLSGQQICLNDSLVLTDLSQAVTPFDPIVGWHWQLGDNSSFSTKGPHKHLYTTPGTYPVSLTITTDSGCHGMKTDTILVLPLPALGMHPQQSCSATPISYSYTPAGQSPTSFRWIFGHGSSSPDTLTGALPVYTWADYGSLQVNLQVINAQGCSHDSTFMVTILESPKAHLVFSPSPVCAQQSISFTDSSYSNSAYPNNYRIWNFGDGTPVVYQTPQPLHVYQAPGIYPLLLRVGNTITGCLDSLVYPIKVNPLPVAVISNTDFCEGALTFLSDSSYVVNDTVVSWWWDLQGYGSFAGAQPQVQFADTGAFSMKLRVMTVNGCTDSVALQAVVHPAPKTFFMMSPSFGIPPLTVNFQNMTQGAVHHSWSFGDGATSMQTHPVHTYSVSGIFDVLLTSSSLFGCMSTHSEVVFTSSPQIDIEVVRVEGVVKGKMVQPMVEFRNNSATDIHSVELTAWLTSGDPVMEMWVAEGIGEVLKPGLVKRYPFVSSISTPAHHPEGSGLVLCARAVIPDLPVDLQPGNNQQCIAVSGSFTVLDPYPNPAYGTMNLDILVEFGDPVRVDLFDIRGKWRTTLYDDFLEDGLNRIVLPVDQGLSGGVWIMQVMYRDQIITKRFIVI